jgi:GAF domain-containing protein
MKQVVLAVEDAEASAQLGRLTRLLEVARMLTSELDLSEIVHQVLQRAIEVIPAADAGTLYLADAASGKLVANDSVGFGPSIFKITLEPGEGAAGKAFHTGHGAIYADPAAVHAALSGARNETRQYFKEASHGLRAPTAAMSAPLIFKGMVLGAVVVDAHQTTHAFGTADLKMLEDFAQIAAIALANARVYGSEHTNRVRLEVLNDEITRQRDELDRRLRALDSMAQVAREGLSLSALAGRLAALASGRAIILDALARPRAVEPRGSDGNEVRSGNLAEVLRGVSHDRRRRSVKEEGVQVVVSPITAGAELLGYVVLEAPQGDADGLNEGLADSAALIASTVFVQERALEEGDVRRRADLLRRLLDGDVPKSGASFRTLPPPLRLAVGKVRMPEGDPVPSAQADVLREVRSTLEQALRNQQVATVVAMRGEDVIVAWSVSEREAPFDAVGKLTGIAKSVKEATGWRVRFALTETIPDPQMVAHAYQEARLALEIRPWSEAAIVDIGRLGAYRLIIGATSGSHAIEFSRRTLGAAVEHDSKHNGHLLRTLRTYFAGGSSLTATAKALNVHVHTVQYRLAKLEELTGLKLSASEDRLTLELSLRISDLAASLDVSLEDAASDD